MNGLIIGWRSLLAGFKEQEKFVWILCSCLDYQIAPKKSLFLHGVRSQELVVKSLSSLKNNILEVCLKLGPFLYLTPLYLIPYCPNSLDLGFIRILLLQVFTESC